MNKIFSEAKNYGTDKNTSHCYLQFYEYLFNAKKLLAGKVLELGIYKGGSLKLWRDYFLNAEIFGIDNNNKCVKRVINEPRINPICCNATDPYELEKKLLGKKFDFIIDDASHSLVEQIDSFKILKNYLTSDGVYIIEDIQDIDRYYKDFLKIANFYIIDLRKNKNKYDDVLLVYHRGNDV